MGDATDARAANSLKGIEISLKNLVRVMEAINNNLVSVGKTFQSWLDTSVEVETVVENKSQLETEFEAWLHERGENLRGDAAAVKEFVDKRMGEMLNDLEKGEDVTTQPSDNDAVEIHDLVEDINKLQQETGQDTTITKDS